MCEEDFFRDMEAFGEALKILRCRRVLTQEVLAKQAGISKKYLVELEKGMHSVGLEITLRLCKALGVNRFELFTLAWEKEYKVYKKSVADRQTKNSCPSDLTNRLFFFSTIQLDRGSRLSLRVR